MSRLKSITTTTDTNHETCPVCRSSRYLNPTLTFLINPECYHKMCSTCVDRIFTAGPANCPIPACHKTLRKRGFHKAFFENLDVEKECDVRRRVGEVYNKRQDDFVGLREWNDYLEEVEGVVWDLMGRDAGRRAKAEERLRAFKALNLKEIEENKRLNLEDNEREKMREVYEKESLRARRLAVQQEEEESKAELERERRQLLEDLKNSNVDPEVLKRQAKEKARDRTLEKVVLKKSSARRNVGDFGGTLDRPSELSTENFTFRGLKARRVAEPEKPYDPFGGISFAPTRYVVQEEYNHEPLARAKKDPRHMAGGYNMSEYYERTLFEAFSGLGVFVEDEVGGSSDISPKSVGLGETEARTRGLSIHGGEKMEVDDVF